MGWPGVGGFSASLSEEMSSASPNRSSAAGFLAVDGRENESKNIKNNFSIHCSNNRFM